MHVKYSCKSWSRIYRRRFKFKAAKCALHIQDFFGNYSLNFFFFYTSRTNSTFFPNQCDISSTRPNSIGQSWNIFPRQLFFPKQTLGYESRTTKLYTQCLRSFLFPSHSYSVCVFHKRFRARICIFDARNKRDSTFFGLYFIGSNDFWAGNLIPLRARSRKVYANAIRAFIALTPSTVSKRTTRLLFDYFKYWIAFTFIYNFWIDFG